ncbi:helix-turn-helix domain-containing protein [Pseudoduganella aquatica]|nr:helix-turn-helix domain-containing protein [Pseudoduganella aquatica]
MEKTDSAQTLMPKGVVDPAGAARRIRLATYPPSAALQPFVDYHWVVEWDLGGRPPETQRVLPYPNAHLVLDRGQTAIHGVVRGAFERKVEGAGKVLGVRFKPGGLRPFLPHPLSRLADRTMPVDEVLGVAGAEAELRVLGDERGRSDADMVTAADALLAVALPPVDERALLAQQAVEAAAAANGPVSVAALSAQLGIEERTLQRLFSNYVGVSPKWVIQRFRLQEATWRLGQAAAPDLAELAARLGFFDQAHFTRSFTQLVGKPPLEYWKSQQTA